MRRVLGALACAAALWFAPAALAAPGNGQLAAVAHGTADRLVTLNPDGSGLRTLWTAPAGTALSRPAWSADGNRIAFSAGGQIGVYDAASGVVSLITSGEDPAWSGNRIELRRGLVLLSVAADGSDPRAFGIALALGTARVSFAPDGQRVAFVVPPALWVSSLDGLQQTLLSTGVRGAPGWTADGTRLAFSAPGNGGQLRIFSLAPPEPATTPLSPALASTSDTAPAWSPDGTQVVYVHEDPAASLVVTGPGGTRTVIAGAAGDPAWQPCTTATLSCTSVAAPVCTTPPSATTQAGQAVDLAPPACSDPGGRPLTVALVEAPAHGTLAGARYTPAPGFAGQDEVAYQASNGVLASNVVRQAIFVVPRTVLPAAAPPRAPFLNARRAPKLDRRGRTTLKAACDVACTVSLRLVVQKRFKSRVVKRSLKAGKVVTLKFKTTKRPPRKLKSAWIVGTVRDAAGRRRAVKLPVTLPR